VTTEPDGEATLELI